MQRHRLRRLSQAPSILRETKKLMDLADRNSPVFCHVVLYCFFNVTLKHLVFPTQNSLQLQKKESWHNGRSSNKRFLLRFHTSGSKASGKRKSSPCLGADLPRKRVETRSKNNKKNIFETCFQPSMYSNAFRFPIL